MLTTPAKNPLILPTKALEDAVAVEWKAHGKYNAAKMPLTALAATAIDRIAGQKDAIVEVLLVYVDTDTLSYRATVEALAKKQLELWDPILAWAGKELGVQWQITSGVMPIDQSPQLHKAIEKYLLSLNDMRLSAACVLSSGLSSLVLTLAVLKGHIDVAEAFRLSRLEEEHQAEQWGRDEEAESRAERLKEEILAAGRFLGLLEG